MGTKHSQILEDLVVTNNKNSQILDNLVVTNSKILEDLHVVSKCVDRIDKRTAWMVESNCREKQVERGDSCLCDVTTRKLNVVYPISFPKNCN
jgi:hypothetical protein